MKRTRVPKKEQLLIEEGAMQRMLRVLFWFPDLEFSLSELAKESGVSKSTASRLLNYLKATDIVTVIDKGIVLRIKANTENREFIKRKIAFNLSSLYHSGLIESLNENLGHPKAVILIGSFLKGEDTSTSDIDIAVETEKEANMESINLSGIEEYEKYFGGRKISIHFFNRKNVDKRSEEHTSEL